MCAVIPLPTTLLSTDWSSWACASGLPRSRNSSNTSTGATRGRWLRGDERGSVPGVQNTLTAAVKLAVLERLYGVAAGPLGWPPRLKVRDSVRAVEPYLNTGLYGEAALTIGGPVHEFEQGQILGVVSVGPLECMPSKVAEAQFFHVAENKGLIPLCLSMNGEPIRPRTAGGFAYDVHTRFGQRNRRCTHRGKPATRSRTLKGERPFEPVCDLWNAFPPSHPSCPVG